MMYPMTKEPLYIEDKDRRKVLASCLNCKWYRKTNKVGELICKCGRGNAPEEDKIRCGKYVPYCKQHRPHKDISELLGENFR